MKNILISLLGVLVIGLLAGYGISWFLQEPEGTGEKQAPTITDELPARSVQLYFSDPEGRYLVAESREIPGCADEGECVRGMVDALIAGPKQGGIAVFPKEARVLGVDIENDLVRINFSRQLVDFHPGGSLSELLTIYSLANSLNENFPYLRQLQILLEGEVRQTLKGHVRIDLPVYADYSLSRPPLGDPESGSGGLSVEKLIEDAGGQ